MNWHTTINIILISFILSMIGFVISFIYPTLIISDLLIMTALTLAALSSIISRLITKNLVPSKIWIFIIVAISLIVISILFKPDLHELVAEIMMVIGFLFVIIVFSYAIIMNKQKLRNDQWIWFLPFVLLGCLLKLMYWYGANIIIFGSFLGISITSFIQLFKNKKQSKNDLFKLIVQIVTCILIVVFYFRYIHFDIIIIAYLYTWLALVDFFFHEELAS